MKPHRLNFLDLLSKLSEKALEQLRKKQHRLNFLLSELLFLEFEACAKDQDLKLGQLLRKLIKAEIKKNT